MKSIVLSICVAVAFCTPAMAHPQHGFSNADGLTAGFLHPWLGLDHLLAMFAVGLLSVRMGRRALWILPSAFVGLMVLGGVIGMRGINLPLAESGIALSVIVLGAALAAARNYPLLAAAIAIGTAGMLHGHAHGTEMPAMVTPTLYAAGFVSATVALHLAGILAGKWLVENQRRAVTLRLFGAAISCAGLLLLLGAI
ncbi:MAG: HupE/UreJ family protein [Betaproteobacteria bacterium]